jgi:hypothetical protein
MCRIITAVSLPILPNQPRHAGLPRWATVALRCVVAVSLSLLVVTVITLLDALSRSPRDEAAVGQLASGAATIVLTVVIAVATVWYASLTRELVVQTEETRDDLHSEIELAREQLEVGKKQLTVAEQQIRVSADQVAESARQVDLARQQVEVTREALVVTTRPVLADVPRGEHPTSADHGGIRLPGYANPALRVEVGSVR